MIELDPGFIEILSIAVHSISSIKLSEIRGHRKAVSLEIREEPQKYRLIDHIKEEILDMLARLTQYPDNSLIPIKDLMTKNHPFYERLSTDADHHFNYHKKEFYYRLRVHWIHLVLSKLQSTQELPAKYLPSLQAFERSSTLNEALIALDQQFMEWNKEKK